MNPELDLYLATSGPYRLAFVSAQIATVAACPHYDVQQAPAPGMLGYYEGMQVIHPGWLWGLDAAQQAPRFLLVLRSGTHALAVDSCRRERVLVAPAPAICADRGVFYGMAGTRDGLTPVLDLARVPLA